MKRVWLAWLVFAVCSAAMLGVMAWGSRELLQLEAREKHTRQEAALEESVRLALWRMETALAPIVVQENARPYAAYAANPTKEKTKEVEKDGKADPKSPPVPASPFVTMRFQMEPGGHFVVARPDGAAVSSSAPFPIAGLRSKEDRAAFRLSIPMIWIHAEEPGLVEERLPVANAKQAKAPQAEPSENAKQGKGAAPEAGANGRAAGPVAGPGPGGVRDPYAVAQMSPGVVYQQGRGGNPETQAQIRELLTQAQGPSANQVQNQNQSSTGTEVFPGLRTVGRGRGGPGGPGPGGQQALTQSERNLQEFQAREQSNNNAAAIGRFAAPPPAAPPPAPVAVTPREPEKKTPAVEVRTGVLEPMWIGDELVLARHVLVGSRDLLQGSLIDWPQARMALLESIEDLLPSADLVPERGTFNPAEGRTLTSLPLRLRPGDVPLSDPEERSPILFSLKIAWACMLVAIVAVGFLLMGAISLSQRRAAFVSSVTHELRTPLTTFRMYTEMLVAGMASDPAKQSQYHQTLYRESDRLVHLVENVLSYARLEHGRYGHREPVAMAGLIGHVTDRLAEHAKLAGMELVVTVDEAAGVKTVSVDVSAIERILFNLADNACKYAARATDRRIHIDVESDERWARITVRDHGPGIQPKVWKLLKPFGKSARDAAKSAPGIGIGLHLSRRLASAAGGRLILVPSDEGASLRLELPLADPRV